MSIGEQIKKVRTAKGLSQKEVVMGASIDKAQFSRIENSKTDPSFSTIEKIAKAMGCSIAELFASAEEIKDIHSHDKSWFYPQLCGYKFNPPLKNKIALLKFSNFL